MNNKTVAFILLLVIALGGCGSGSPDESVPTPDNNVMVADVLAAAVAQRVLVDNSFGGDDVFERVEVIDTVGFSDEEDGFVLFGGADDRVLTEDERSVIEAALPGRQVTFVPMDHQIEGDGSQPIVALISVAEPVIEDGEAVVASGLVCGPDCGIGGSQSFILDDSGAWTFEANIGDQWIS